MVQQREKSEDEDPAVAVLLSDYNQLRAAAIELRRLRKGPKEQTMRRLEANVGKVIDLANRRWLPLYEDDIEIVKTIDAVGEATDVDPHELVQRLVEERYGNGAAEALRRHQVVTATVAAELKARGKRPLLLAIPRANPIPLPAYRQRQTGAPVRRKPRAIGDLYKVAYAEARRLGLSPDEVLAPLQGRRSKAHDRVKHGRVRIARRLREERATNRQIGEVLGGIDASAVSRLLSDAETGLKKASRDAVELITKCISNDLQGGGAT